MSPKLGVALALILFALITGSIIVIGVMQPATDGGQNSKNTATPTPDLFQATPSPSMEGVQPTPDTITTAQPTAVVATPDPAIVTPAPTVPPRRTRAS